MSISIQHFFDPGTSTLTYVVHDPATRDALVIDPVWDFDPASGALTTKSMDGVVAYLRENNLNPLYVLETHAHADHISSSQLFKKFFPLIKVAINERITEVQKTFARVFNYGDDFDVTGKAFDMLLKDGQVLNAGSLSLKVIFTPGHTPACTSFLIEDALFVGDAMFMPDSGTGRCDFPAGSAESLFESVQKIYSLPDSTRIFVGHDYQPAGRELRFQTTVGQEKAENIQLKGSTSKSEFVEFRTKRDAGLSAPKLLLPSIQVNINAGKLPGAESNGKSYLKIPVK